MTLHGLAAALIFGYIKLPQHHPVPAVNDQDQKRHDRGSLA
jgi:hypothetical protein